MCLQLIGSHATPTLCLISAHHEHLVVTIAVVNLTAIEHAWRSRANVVLANVVRVLSGIRNSLKPGLELFSRAVVIRSNPDVVVINMGIVID